jgi:hypothetical protein
MVIIYDVIVNYRTQLPEVVEISIDEKPKTFVRTTADHASAYNRLSRIPKDKAWLTAEDAVESYIMRKAKRIEMLERDLKRDRLQLVELQKLKEKG